MNLRRRLAMLIAIAFVASACSSATTSSGTAAATKLTIAAVQGVEDAGLKALAPMYKQQKGVEIQIVEAPYDDLYSKLVNTFKANDATYDLIMMDDPWMPKFGTDGSLSDLGALGITPDPDIAPVVWDVGTWPPPRGPVPPTEKSKPKQLLGATIVGNVEMFMYRNDLTPTAPATYDEVLANAKAQNKPGSVAGYIIRGKATNPVVADFLPILWSQGGDVFDENWNVVLDSDASKAAIGFLVNDLKSVAQTDPGSTDASDRDKVMANGQGYQSSVWPGEINTAVLDPAVTKVAGKVTFIPIPKGTSGKGVGMMGNWLLGVPKASKNQQAAADFIKWMLQKDTQLTYAQNQGIPSRTSVLKDPSLTAANPYFPVLADALQAPPNWRPRTDQWNAVETIIGTHLNKALTGGETADQAATGAAAEIRTLMKGAGYPTQ
ncbi:MAG: multiple sugar transport system substrate-binding protein [Chloroflexota bacterium]|jgi:multiple sugar transport system substrate-binding protein|nr:multiple sugar transport system substrate-binding protein [Chloroflexota bacterium]